MRLDAPLEPLLDVFQLALHGIERVAQCHVYVFMRMILNPFPIHDELLAQSPQLDADLKQIALVMMMMGRLDHHVATGDAVAKPLEAAHTFQYAGLYCV
jgi:hypothetical protein